MAKRERGKTGKGQNGVVEKQKRVDIGKGRNGNKLGTKCEGATWEGTKWEDTKL